MSVIMQIAYGRIVVTKHKIPAEYQKRKQKQGGKHCQGGTDKVAKLSLVADALTLISEKEIKRERKKPKVWEEEKKEKKTKNRHVSDKKKIKRRKKRTKPSAIVISLFPRSNPREYKLSEGNPAGMSWEEILLMHNGGSRETIFGRIMPQFL